MQIWSYALIVTVPTEEECKFWLCLCLFLVRDVLYRLCKRGMCCAGSRGGFGVDRFGEV